MKNKTFKTRIKSSIAYALIFIGMVSCDSFVESELPNNQLTGPAIFKDRITADAAMGNVYASIRNTGVLTGAEFGISNRLGCYADELDFYGNVSNATNEFYNNSLLPLNQGIQVYWNTTYNQIYMANAVYEGVVASNTIPAEDANRLKGEALFTRALMHFYLVNLFGEIPYISTTDYQTNSTVSREHIPEVYGKIVADLTTALTLVPENYYGTGRARPNKAAVNALLARTYLYMGFWPEAANAAAAVLNQTDLYADEPDMQKVFLKDCTETIWQLPPHPEGRNTFEAATFTVLAAPPNSIALAPELVAVFSGNDLRRLFWISSISGTSQTYYFAHKYRQNNPGAASTEYSILFRLAEMYLIRAEARANQGETIAALEDLNHIRQKAGLEVLTGLGQQQLQNEIASERRKELFTEFGHRFFDLKRTNTINSILGASKPGWDSTDQLFPIPENELSANPNLLPQNPGY